MSSSSPEREVAGVGYRQDEASDLVPRPDPTTLTTQLVDRALAAFREVMETRLAALDEATRLAAEKVDEIPVRAAAQRDILRLDLERLIKAERELQVHDLAALDRIMLEKFDGIDKRFLESKEALAAALAAQKEAVAAQNESNAEAIRKSEAATQKQIDEVKVGVGASVRALDDKIADLKSRLDRGEGETRGTEFYRKGERQQGMDARALVFSIIGVVVAVAVIAVAIINASGS